MWELECRQAKTSRDPITDFDASADALIALKQAGASEKVIASVLNARKRKIERSNTATQLGVSPALFRVRPRDARPGASDAGRNRHGRRHRRVPDVHGSATRCGVTLTRLRRKHRKRQKGSGFRNTGCERRASNRSQCISVDPEHIDLVECRCHEQQRARPVHGHGEGRPTHWVWRARCH